LNDKAVAARLFVKGPARGNSQAQAVRFILQWIWRRVSHRLTTVLKQFGLIDNQKVDDLLATAFGREKERSQKLQPIVKQELAKEASR
jgi:hypothetical protein